MWSHEGFKPATLANVIEAFPSPAYVVTTRGCVIGANAAAMDALYRPPRWLSAVIRRPESATTKKLCSIHGVSAAGIPLWVVRPRVDVTKVLGAPGSRAVIEALPESLVVVAELALCGLSDRQIAECSELSVASTRTYTVRILRKLGCSSRTELIHRALTDEDAPTFESRGSTRCTEYNITDSRSGGSSP